MGRANVVPDPCTVGAKDNDASSLALRFPLLFSGVLSSSLAPVAVANPILVFGRLGGGTTNLSSASERVVSERPDVSRNVFVPVPVPVEPSENLDGRVFPDCDVEGRFRGDAGRGSFDGDEGGTTLNEPPALVDVDVVELPTAATGTTEGFALMNILSDACFNLLGSGGIFDTEVDL